MATEEISCLDSSDNADEWDHDSGVHATITKMPTIQLNGISVKSQEESTISFPMKEKHNSES